MRQPKDACHCPATSQRYKRWHEVAQSDLVMGDRHKPAVGLLKRGEAYLIPTWLMREQRLAQVKIIKSTLTEATLTHMTACMSTAKAGCHRNLLRAVHT